MNISSRTYIFSAVFCSIFFLHYSVVHLAHAEVKYSVLPLVIDTELEARDIVTRKITVTNTGSDPVTVFPMVNNISLTEGGTIQEFLSPVDSDRTQSLASWIEISRRGELIKAGEHHEFELTFRVHPEPVAGTYHAFVGFGYGRNTDEAEKQVREGQAPGTMITVTIKDKKFEHVKLAGFTVSRFITGVRDEGAAYTFANTGDEPVTPKGEIILYDSRGNEVSAIPVNEENITIAPGDRHVFVESLPVTGLGKYKAFLSVEYGSDQRASIQDTNFYYVLPAKKVGIAALIAFLCIIAISWFIHKKYFDDDTEDLDDSERLALHIREGVSESKEHDVIMKQL